MAKKNQGNGGSDNNNEVLVFFAILLIGFMLWMAFHTRIAGLLLSIRGAEASIIGLFTVEIVELKAWMKYVPRSTVTASQMFEVSTQVGSYVRWLCTPVLLGLAIWLFLKSPTERFKTVYTDRTLPVAVAQLYPWMKISVKLDFTAMDINKGPWAVAMTERQFTRMHKLRDERGEIDRDRATTVFVKQLGALWLGYEALKPHAKAIFSLCAARMNKDFVAGDKLLIQLANSAADGVLDYAGVDDLAKKYMDSKPMRAILKSHAYERTILMSMLQRARGGDTGKDYLPPNWFLWLKGVDRSLWYALSDVGRRTFHVESAGVFSHWLAEVARKKRLEMPWVKKAVDGLIVEMGKFTNDDDTDEGLVETDELLEPEDLPPAPRIPSPEKAALAFKTGKGLALAGMAGLQSPAAPAAN